MLIVFSSVYIGISLLTCAGAQFRVCGSILCAIVILAIIKKIKKERKKRKKKKRKKRPKSTQRGPRFEPGLD